MSAAAAFWGELRAWVRLETRHHTSPQVLRRAWVLHLGKVELGLWWGKDGAQ